MVETDEESIDEPTTSESQAEQETAWMAKEWLSIALVSIFATLLFAFGLMQATGLVETPAPIAETALGGWYIFIGLSVVLIALFLWSRRGV